MCVPLPPLPLVFTPTHPTVSLRRREAVGALSEAVDSERAKVAQYTEQLAALDEEIADSKAALSRFRAEFEQLRVALLVDRMAKSTQVAGLADRRRRLAEEVQSFEQAVAEARRRTAAEENRKWEARIAAEREAGEARIAQEKAAIDEKIEKVKQSLAQQYEAGFQPLLQEAESRHTQVRFGGAVDVFPLQRVVLAGVADVAVHNLLTCVVFLFFSCSF